MRSLSLDARSIRGNPGSGYEQFLGHVGLAAAPGSVDETAEEVSSLGATIAVRCDHTNEAEIEHR